MVIFGIPSAQSHAVLVGISRVVVGVSFRNVRPEVAVVKIAERKFHLPSYRELGTGFRVVITTC